jgi:hypothetical protein
MVLFYTNMVYNYQIYKRYSRFCIYQYYSSILLIYDLIRLSQPLVLFAHICLVSVLNAVQLEVCPYNHAMLYSEGTENFLGAIEYNHLNSEGNSWQLFFFWQ